MDNLVAMSGALGKDPPGGEVIAEISLQSGNITGIWICTKGAEGRDYPFDGEEPQVAETFD